jgi:hypothetical protein
VVCERHPPDSVRHIDNVSPAALARNGKVSHRDRGETLPKTRSCDPKYAIQIGDVKTSFACVCGSKVSG